MRMRQSVSGVLLCEDDPCLKNLLDLFHRLIMGIRRVTAVNIYEDLVIQSQI